jgi:hypothetical protein
MVSVRIPLTQNKFARVSIQDAERVMAYSWSVMRVGLKEYGVRSQHVIGSRQPLAVLLHRFIMQPDPDQEVDHVDNDGLKCTRDNLRVCTHAQNNQNKGLRADSKSGFKGVGWNSQKKKWQARISANKSHHHIGFFDNKKDAARAYDREALRLHGEYARTNESLGLLD